MTKRFLPFLLLLSILTVVFASCKKETENERFYPQATRGYFPLQIGRYVVYDVDSVIWNDFDCTRKEHHLNMRYTVADTFTDNQGRPSYRIDVIKRVADTGVWKVSTVMYATPTATSIEVVMNNLRMEKLIFPVSEGATWFGNRAIDTNVDENKYYGNWLYQYVNFLKPYNNGRLNFDNTISVYHINDSLNNPEVMPAAYAERTFSREVYGYDVGMIYKEFTHWTYDPSNPTTACRKGFSVVMRAIDHN
jgi:hypothetical protein